ncbi:MAG: hypothetical protein ACOC2U_00005, partial [bacterium]
DNVDYWQCRNCGYRMSNDEYINLIANIKCPRCSCPLGYFYPKQEEKGMSATEAAKNLSENFGVVKTSFISIKDLEETILNNYNMEKGSITLSERIEIYKEVKQKLSREFDQDLPYFTKLSRPETIGICTWLNILLKERKGLKVSNYQLHEFFPELKEYYDKHIYGKHISNTILGFNDYWWDPRNYRDRVKAMDIILSIAYEKLYRVQEEGVKEVKEKDPLPLQKRIEVYQKVKRELIEEKRYKSSHYRATRGICNWIKDTMQEERGDVMLSREMYELFSREMYELFPELKRFYNEHLKNSYGKELGERTYWWDKRDFNSRIKAMDIMIDYCQEEQKTKNTIPAHKRFEIYLKTKKSLKLERAQRSYSRGVCGWIREHTNEDVDITVNINLPEDILEFFPEIREYYDKYIKQKFIYNPYWWDRYDFDGRIKAMDIVANNCFDNIKKEFDINIPKELPKKWEDLKTIKGYYIESLNSKILKVEDGPINPDNRNIYPTKELAEAGLALTQLLQLREAYYQEGWAPEQDNYAIRRTTRDEMKVINQYGYKNILSFKTREIAEKFLDNFRDLIETAQPLL